MKHHLGDLPCVLSSVLRVEIVDPASVVIVSDLPTYPQALAAMLGTIRLKSRSGGVLIPVPEHFSASRYPFLSNAVINAKVSS